VIPEAHHLARREELGKKCFDDSSQVVMEPNGKE